MIRALCALLLLVGSLPSTAHQVDAITLDFEETDRSWKLLGSLDLTFMMPETRNDPDAEVIRRWGVMHAPRSEQERMRGEMTKVLRRCVSFTLGEQPLDYELVYPEFALDPLVLIEDQEGWAFFQVELVAQKAAITGDLVVHWEDETGAALILQQMVGDESVVWEIQPGDGQKLLEISAASAGVETSPDSSVSGSEGGAEESLRWAVPAAAVILSGGLIWLMRGKFRTKEL